MKKKDRNIFCKVFLFIAVFFLIDTLSGGLFYKLYSKSQSGISSQEFFIINKTDQDLLIFGPSTAAYHYNPKILQEELNVSVYNAGREGAGIFFQYGLLIATLNRYSPKHIILDLNFRDIYARGGSFSSEALSLLHPFFGKINNEFDSLLITNKYDQIFLNSNLYRYNSKIFKLIYGNLLKENGFNSGFKPLFGQYSGSKWQIESENLEVDESLIACLEKFILKTIEHEVNLVIVISPQYYIVPETFLDPLFSITSKHSIPVYNYLSDPEFLNEQSLFKDVGHLNNIGAQKFSHLVSNELKKQLTYN